MYKLIRSRDYVLVAWALAAPPGVWSLVSLYKADRGAQKSGVTCKQRLRHIHTTIANY
jgi:hypothetical protein